MRESVNVVTFLSPLLPPHKKDQQIMPGITADFEKTFSFAKEAAQISDNITSTKEEIVQCCFVNL